MNLILCGLPNSGKSTIGSLLARELNRTFIDTDRLIEKTFFENEGRSLTCRQIYLEKGEQYFRDFEKEQIIHLHISGAVIAIGGGSLFREENCSHLLELGRFIYLKTSLPIIWQRMCESGIPAYLDSTQSKKKLYELAKMRIPHYEAAASIVVETDWLNPQEIISSIVEINARLDHG